jgi:hypothetical protein
MSTTRRSTTRARSSASRPTRQNASTRGTTAAAPRDTPRSAAAERSQPPGPRKRADWSAAPANQDKLNHLKDNSGKKALIMVKQGLAGWEAGTYTVTQEPTLDERQDKHTGTLDQGRWKFSLRGSLGGVSVWTYLLPDFMDIKRSVKFRPGQSNDRVKKPQAQKRSTQPVRTSQEGPVQRQRSGAKANAGTVPTIAVIACAATCSPAP